MNIKLGRRKAFIAWLPRLLGLIGLVALLWQVGWRQLWLVLTQSDWTLLVIAILAIIPLIFIKTVRWRGILKAQGIELALWPAFLAFFSGIFVGLLTPGRLGEFIRAYYVKRESTGTRTQGLLSVLIDRLFDLFLLLLVSTGALLAIAQGYQVIVIIILSVLAGFSVLLILANKRILFWFRKTFHCFTFLGRFGAKVDTWLVEIHHGLRTLSVKHVLKAVLWTLLAYLVYFGQCYLLALSLGLSVGFIATTFAVALGSLAALLPISIAGLGTREMSIVLYLGTLGISSDNALSFSLLVFTTFYLFGGAFGAIAWAIHPVKMMSLRREFEDDSEASLKD